MPVLIPCSFLFQNSTGTAFNYHVVATWSIRYITAMVYILSCMMQVHDQILSFLGHTAYVLWYSMLDKWCLNSELHGEKAWNIVRQEWYSLLFQGERHYLWYCGTVCVHVLREKSLCVIPVLMFQGEGIVCAIYAAVCVNVSGEKALCVIPVLMFQERRHCVWYLCCSLCCFQGEGIVCDTYGTVCVPVLEEKSLCVILVWMFQCVCVIPMVQSVLMFQERRHCVWYLWCSLCVSGEKALCVIPMLMFQERRHCVWYPWCSLCVSGEKALCVIPMVQSVCFRREGIVCDTYGTVCVNVSGEKALCVIPMVQSVCFRGKGIVCDTYGAVCVFQERRHCVWYLWYSLC